MYKIIIGNKAQKDLRSFPLKTINQIDSAITALESNPRPYNSKKLRAVEGWRIRIGDYRILYSIDDAEHAIVIYRIRHRRESYR